LHGIFSEPAHRHLPRTRVLLVEDVPANQLVTATLLRRAGHDVDIASNGELAVGALRAKPYDIVFIDVFMPIMGGQEATRIIRALPGQPGHVPIIAITGRLSPGDDASLQASGMDGVLGKPVSLAEMLDALLTKVWSRRSEAPWA